MGRVLWNCSMRAWGHTAQTERPCCQGCLGPALPNAPEAPFLPGLPWLALLLLAAALASQRDLTCLIRGVSKAAVQLPVAAVSVRDAAAIGAAEVLRGAGGRGAALFV